MIDTQDIWAWRRKVFKLAIPIMLANITVPLVGIVDTAVMGRMADPVYLGATAIGATIFSSIFWLFGFLRMGTGGMVAQALGANNQLEIRQTIVRALFIGALIGVVIFLLQGLIFAITPYAFSTDEKLLGLVRDYFQIRIFSAPATLMVYAALGALIGLQRMAAVMVVQLVLNVSNITLNLFFFGVLSWGIQGVALASVIADYLALAIALLMLSRQIPLHPRQFLDKALLSSAAITRFLDVSGNLFVRTLCLTAAFYWLTSTSSSMGIEVLAANAVLIQMIHMMAYGLDGFSHAAETLCGNAYGRRDKSTFNVTVRVSAEWGLMFAVLISAAYWFAGDLILATMTTQTDIQQLAGRYLPWVALAPLVSVWGFLLDGIYIGVTHTREMRNGMLISLFVFLGASILLPSLYGNHGLWAAYYVLMLARAATLAFWYPNITTALKR